MDHQRYVETGSHSFYGEYLYDQIVPQGHFLRKLRQVIDRHRFTCKLIKLFNSIADVSTDKDRKRRKKGKGPHNPDAQWWVKHTRKAQRVRRRREKIEPVPANPRRSRTILGQGYLFET
jgi:hypothetical protein